MKLLISSVLCIFVGLPLAAQSVVFDVQALLNKYGYSVGVVDGVAGNKTKSALKKFYQDNTLEFDGQISDNELYDLNVYGRFNSNAYQPPKRLLNEIGGKLSSIWDLEFKGFVDVISDKARNPVSVSNEYSKFGNSSLRFEVNNGECGFNDCFSGRDRERAEVKFKEEPTKKERWYRIYIYLPSNQVSISPASNVLMQWKEREDDRLLLGVEHTDSGLAFNLNGDAFQDFRALILPNDQLLGKWTEVLINTNWHPDQKKAISKYG